MECCTRRAGEHAIKVCEMILWGAGIDSTDASCHDFGALGTPAIRSTTGFRLDRPAPQA
jgi:hypothetical protein